MAPDENLTELSIADLKPDPNNPRVMPEDHAKGLAASIDQFGDLSGIVWNRRSGFLIAGHQRMKQLEELHGSGNLRIVSNVVDEPTLGVHRESWAILEPGGEYFPIRVVDWPREKAAAALLAANNAAIQGTWSEDVFAMMETAKEYGPDEMAQLQMDELLKEAEGMGLGAPDEVVEDEAPELPEKPVTRSGDLWLLGAHRVLCGDSTEEESVSRLCGTERAALMNTDPPYGIDYAALKNGIPRSGFRDIQARSGDMKNDDLTDGATLQAFLEAAIRAALPHMIENPAFYWIRGKPCAWHGNKSQVSVWEIGESQQGRVHPTQKPVALFTAPILNHTRVGDIVYEPFAGSGSQFIAAEQLGRRCFGIELEPKYCDVICHRWANLTGEEPTLESTGESFSDVEKARQSGGPG